MSAISLHSIATANPPYCFRQDDVMAKACEVFGHKPELMQRMAKSYGNAGVKQRYSCVPLEWYASPHGWPERMRLFEENAVALLTTAGAAALKQAGVDPKDVAATVTVSSTGIVTPSLDSLLQEPLGLAPTVQRLPVFGLGCAGGVIGLSRAAAMARAMPGKWVLFLCTELCGLTFRQSDDSKANIIGTTIFGDGAAAVLLRADDGEGALARITAWGEHTWPGSRDIMGWRVEDDGLGVVFSRSIPNLVRDQMRGVTDTFLAAQGLLQKDIDGLIVHPGGEKVLEALEECYGMKEGGLEDARAVLGDHGNMSAVTVLAVLARTLARKPQGRHLVTALGPGFSVGMCLMDLP
ncbi:MAG: type III polyketide synthase [Rhodospirillaceae bacterium]|nr:type III polyketide synthase [Rhodospirillaceae bacterium]